MFAPVILFVYNRPAHTKATLEALRRNTLAAQSDLIIFSDAPKNEAAEDLVRDVRNIISDVAGFASVRIVYRDTNFGLAKSVISGVTEVMGEYGRVIVLEDDLVTTQRFMEFMNKALDYYETDSKVFSIGGYQFPEGTMTFPGRYRYDTYASYRCCSWGWATWRDRWERIDWSMSYFDDFMASSSQQTEFNRGGPDMTQMLILQKAGKIDSWAIRFCYAHFVGDTRCIYPVKSMINNIGLDNSGVHCGVDPRRQHKELDNEWIPHSFCPADSVDPEIAAAFYQAFCPEPATSEALTPRIVLRKARSLVRRGLHLARRIGMRGRQILHPPSTKVDVLVVNTFQKDGGAARAAYRTFLGVQRLFPAAQYLNLVKEDLRPDIAGRYHWSLKGLLATRFASLDRIPMARYPNRKPVSFTPAVVANPLRVPLSRFKANLVHLHWVASSLLRIEELGRLKVPVVWTLHDTWAFTGGCHYTGDCDGFTKECGACPQLGSTRDDDLSRTVWRRKQRVYSGLDLAVVTPSHWLADVARSSSLLAGRRVEVIPNGLDTNVFKPIDRRVAKEYLGVDSAKPVLLFGAQWLTDWRKGGDLLCDAITHLDFPCTLLVFGEGNLSLQTDDRVTVRAVGTLKDDMSLAMMYSAADIFVCPSREDNLPNTVAEALACGTPCAAFDVNGLPEMIEHQKTGWLAKAFDAEDLAAGIGWLARHPDQESLRQAARDKALADYSMERMMERYAALYAELLGSRPS